MSEVLEMAPEAADSCDRCSGKGFADTDNGKRVCDCPAGELQWWHQSAACGVPKVWRHEHLIVFRAVGAEQLKAVKAVKEWGREVYAWKQAKSRRDYQPAPQGLLIHGNTGVGKSRLTAATVNSLIRSECGLRMLWINTPSLYLEALASQSDNGETVSGILEKLAFCDVLILDDLGAEKPSDFAATLLYSVFNERSESDRIILANSNLGPAELESRIGERNSSRLAGLCRELTVGGKDQRRAKGVKA